MIRISELHRWQVNGSISQTFLISSLQVYLHDYQNVREAREGLSQYFGFYNKECFHSSLGNNTPEEVYIQRKTAFLNHDGLR